MRKTHMYGLYAAFAVLVTSAPAFADTTEANDVFRNMVDSVELLPGLISALAYGIGLILAITGLFKLKDHVENPNNTALRVPVIRFLIGGFLFSLPILYDAMFVTINGEGDSFFDRDTTIGLSISAFLGELAENGITLPSVNNILANIVDAIHDFPGLVSAAAYLLGLLFGVSALIKIKEHVETPDNVPLKEGVIRLLAGGAFFALPTIYMAMTTAISGDGLGISGQITSMLSAVGAMYSVYEGATCVPLVGTSLGGAMCDTAAQISVAPAFLSAMAYVFGLVLGFWGILKIKDHVVDPSRVPIWEGVSKFIAGGAFFSLPLVIEVVRSTITPATLNVAALAPTTGFNDGSGLLGNRVIGFGCGGAGDLLDGIFGDGTDSGGLDTALLCLANDVLGPMHILMNVFAFIAGTILIMIGISRLTKSAQDGARGPGGIGTVMTFVTGGMLISYNEMVRAFTQTLGMGKSDLLGLGIDLPLGVTATYATLAYTQGMSDAEIAHAHHVISAIIKFMIVIGLVSTIRGIFILRGAAEGNQQSSLMAGVTHLVGGALAVNLGPLINAVQSTLGIAEYGISFGGSF